MGYSLFISTKVKCVIKKEKYIIMKYKNRWKKV